MRRQLWVVTVVLAGCYNPRVVPGAPCGANESCPEGLVCSPATGTCERTALPADALTDTPDDTLDAIDARVLAACPANDARLAACYGFEGTTNDSSTNANHPSIAANITYTPGINGSALVLSANSNVRVPDTASLDLTTASTLDTWIRLQAYPAPGARAMIVDHNGGYAAYINPSGLLTCSVSVSVSTRFDSPAAIPLGTWTHLACTYDGTTLRMWIGGVEVGSRPATGTIQTAATEGTRIGGNIPDGTNPTDDPLIGALDQLRFWGAALPATELCAAAGC